jgi:hypothetical protein
MTADIVLYDEPQTDVIRLSWANQTGDRTGKVPRLNTPYRYTDPVWGLGAEAISVKLTGVFIPPYTSAGTQWTTSSGADPTPTINKWKRLGTRLTYSDETGTLTSANVVSYQITLTPGIPLSQIVYWQMEIKQGIEP